ncbi:response regulator [Alkalimarinus sediminis]|uniref:Response regulator n=1 Tax=Alkalimarinus sediminis TaxID=1632866 RepID=A0A9E8KRI1_9ALTE|nr:response regulator [Alkalimarinus sediminis]UZW76400.1 response regulator [Alkalimarinus sediminis]
MAVGRHTHIILVEDNPDDELLTIREIKNSGFRGKITSFSDGEEAFRYLTMPKKLPTLIILDVKLPKLNGIEILRQIRAQKELVMTPVVMFSSCDEPGLVEEAYSIGANSYVIKEDHFLESTDQLTGLVHYWTKIHRPISTV